MVTTTKLFNANRDMKMGNHRKNIVGDTTEYIYHWTAIVVVNEKEKTYYTNNGGWNTRSTNRAIGDYRYLLETNGYKKTEGAV